jgi:hypothetical protein
VSTRPATIADRLRRARRGRFVGRDAELELVRGALEAPEPDFALLFVHGPGGVGKSALLRATEDMARDVGARPVRLDLRVLEPSPPRLCAAIAGALGADEDDVRAGRLGPGRHVLLLDAYETAGPLDAWLREQLVPALPAGTLVVLAGRAAPGPDWRGDPAWADLLRVVALRNLAPDDARAYLSSAGVPEGWHGHVLALTHGHPLALSLLVDVLAQRPEPPAGLGDTPDVVAELVARFAADVPSPRHRAALDVFALARVTTQGLLRHVFGEEDAAELFGWLRELSFAELADPGLLPHDLARDVLAADLKWRDPEDFAAVHARVREHVVARLHGPEETALTAAADLVFLHRGNPFTARFWEWERFSDAYADELGPGDRDALLDMTARHDGPAQAALVAHWLDRQPQGFIVFRGSGGRALGFAAMLALHEASEEDIAADPGASAMWRYAQEHEPPRPGEEVHAGRFFMDAEAYQAPSPSLNVLTVASTHLWCLRRRPAWELLGVWRDPEMVTPLMAYIEFERVPEADYEIAGTRFGVFAHDWRRMDAERWLDVMGERERAEGFDPAARPGAAPPLLALSQVAFAEAVRDALRDLHRPAALATNPLQQSRVVREHGALTELLDETIAELAVDPRDAKLHRALVRTYVRPAPTQEAAAEVLGLPFSTYRGHLTRGIDRVVERLWQRELHGD